MRIISGHLRGKKLIPIHGLKIRPTSDRVRESVFNILGRDIQEARVLDLFAGTGALGIEALSRGAARATFMDQACEVVRKNIDLCRLNDSATIISCDLTKQNFCQKIADQFFDIVFMDPPYQQGFLEKILGHPDFLSRLSDQALIIAEHSNRENIEIPHPGLDIYRQKKYSSTIISFINRN